MVLHSKPSNMKIMPKGIGNARPRWAVAHCLPNSSVAFQNIQRSSHALARKLRRQNTSLGSSTRMQRLGHGIHTEGLQKHTRSEERRVGTACVRTGRFRW